MRLLYFIGALFVLWLPLAIPILIFLRHNNNLASIVNYVVLFFELIFLWRFWGQAVYGETEIFARYGLVRSRINAVEFVRGLAIGCCFCWSLFIAEAILGWIEIAPPSVSLIRIVIEGFLSAIALSLVEELIFRGWLVDELKRDYRKGKVIGIGATIFALLHFLKPVSEIIRTAVTFPALMLLGIILIIAKYNHGDRLGNSIGIHGGLVWAYYIVNVGSLIRYTNQVPVWITGIDGNPIAGVMGIIFLASLLWLTSRKLLSKPTDCR